jgi:hypothetical protein
VRAIWTLAAVAAIAAGAIAMTIGGTTDDSIPDARYIEYGRGFAPYTMRLTGVDEDGKPLGATATAIADRWALTAAHVVDGATEIVVGGIPAARTHIPKAFFGVGQGDIALVEMSRPFGLEWYPPLSEGDERVGQVVSVAGYGHYGKLTTGHEFFDGRLRAGTQKIERFADGLIVCHAKCGSSPLEICIAPGDSGGPLFAGGKVAGVNSFTFDRPKKEGLRSREGEETAHTRVSLHRDWILTFLATPR